MVLFDAFLRKLQAVEDLSNEEQRAAINLCRDKRIVAKRRDIVCEGDNPDSVHIILSGWAARYNILPDGSRRISAFLLPGDFCDIHVTVLAEMDHSILALTDCEIAYVCSDQIYEITRSSPALTRALWRSTLIDESILRQWFVNAGRRDAVGSIAHLMCELHARMKLVGLVQDGQLSLPLTQAEIGDALGLTPVHVNRMLRDLRQQGLLAVTSGVMVVPDVTALAASCVFSARYLHLRSLAQRAP